MEIYMEIYNQKKMNELVMVSEKNEYSSAPIDEINVENVRHIINRNDHPHPVVLIIIIITLMILLYYIYAAFVKTCFNGEWISNEGHMKVKHNKWNDSILVNGFVHGHVKGNAVYLIINNKLSLGVLYDDTIYWIGGEIWKRPINIY
jgi:hypothetical protein